MGRGLGAGELEHREITDPLLAASWGETVHRLRLSAATSGSATLTVRRVRGSGTTTR